MPIAIIALGGNVGDVPQTFRRAVELLVSEIADGPIRVSPNYRSTPVGAVAGETFWNAAVAVETHLPAPSVLGWLQTIESSLGRTREVHWGPRTLDLDLIFYGDDVLQLPHLSVPHPHTWYRRFVLDPLCDLCPERVHPEIGLTVRELRDRLLARPLPILCGGASSPTAHQLAELQQEFPMTCLSVAVSPTDLAPHSGLGVWFDAPLAAHQSFWVTTTSDEPIPFLRDVLRASVGEIWQATPSP